jgi:hypothetical protein
MKEHSEEIYERIITEGESGIDKFIVIREAENLFLDFKRSATDGAGNKLHQNDRSNLAKAISGFGNSEGGVIVWGVDCREGEDYADVACAKYPLEDAQRFASWLEGAISSSTIPPHSGVQNKAVISGEGPKGFVVTFIPKSNDAPHQVISSGKGQYHYYIRAGSDFVPTPHAVLAGMFGRRPQPSVFHMFLLSNPEVIDLSGPQVKSTLGLQVGNGGRGIASDLFMTIKAISIPGPNCRLAMGTPDLNNWTVWSFLDIHFTAISKSNIKLPPEAQLQPFVLTMILSPPFTDGLKIEGLCGCGQAPSFSFTIENKANVIERLYNDFISKYPRGLPRDFKTAHEEYDFWNLREKSELARKAYKTHN